MQADDVYALTNAGDQELRSSSTRLSAGEIAILVRLDGVLTVSDVEESLPVATRGDFPGLLQTLLAQRLIGLAEIDPMELRLRADLDSLTSLVDEDQATARLASLERSGFYVQIARERAEPPARPGSARLTAVVVEDEPVLAAFIRSYLRLSGFDVRLAADRAETVAAFRQGPVPDLVLLDVMLPDVDGFEILAQLRQNRAFRNVPVIMLTGKATRQAVIKGIAGGADGYLTKPFEPEALMRAVRTILRLPEECAQLPSANDGWVNRDAIAQRGRGR